MESSSSLRSLALIASKIENAIVEAEGEINEVLENDLVLAQYSIANKIDAYHYSIQKIEKTIEFHKDELKAIGALITRLESAQAWMLDNIQSAVENLSKSHLSGNKYVASLVLNPTKVDVLDEALIPSDFFITKTTKSLDKKKISETLKLGIEVEGARLIQTKKIKFKLKSDLLA